MESVRMAARHDDIPTIPSSVMLNGKSANSRFSPEDKVDSAAACEILYSTMKTLNVNRSFNYDHPLFPDSERYWDSLNLDAPTLATIRKIGGGPIALGDLTYPFLPRENRLAIGIFTTYLVLVDDGPVEQLKLFRKHCTSDRSKLMPVWQHFADYVDHLASFYGPHGGDMIWGATFQFLNATIVEGIHGKGVVIPRSAGLFPYFLRVKGGVSEAYASAVFSQADLPEDDWLLRCMLVVPDLMEFINLGNDAMSFYKEHVIGDEQCTYIWNYCSCHDKPLIDGLKDTASRVLNAVDRMRRSLSDQPKLLARLEMLFQGYMQWHWVYENRYLLQDMHKLHGLESVEVNGKIETCPNGMSNQ